MTIEIGRQDIIALIAGIGVLQVFIVLWLKASIRRSVRYAVATALRAHRSHSPRPKRHRPAGSARTRSRDHRRPPHQSPREPQAVPH